MGSVDYFLFSLSNSLDVMLNVDSSLWTALVVICSLMTGAYSRRCRYAIEETSANNRELG